MPEPLTAPLAEGRLHGATLGFCGKMPARGDFVAFRLPRGFVDPWYDWMQSMLQASRALLGEGWLAAWNRAPVWRFALSPGLCGRAAVLGLWLPSVDRVGRPFPLTFAAVAEAADARALLRCGVGFLALAEAAGLDAVARDLEPDDIAARLSAGPRPEPGQPGIVPEACPDIGAVWWSKPDPEGGTAVIATPALPEAEIFAGMLQGESQVPETR
jgi:type VI secretion system protein ImpM